MSERMGMRGKIKLPPISIYWPRHSGKFESHQTLPFLSKMHQNHWRLGLRPRPRWGSLQRPQLLDGLEGEEKGREGMGKGGKGRGEMCPLYEILNTPLLTEPLPRLMSGFALELKLPQVLRPTSSNWFYQIMNNNYSQFSGVSRPRLGLRPQFFCIKTCIS